MIVFIAFIFIILIILWNQKEKFIYYIPLLLQLTDISKIFIEGGPGSSTGILLDFFIVIVSLAICLYVILGNFSFIRKNNNGIFLFLIYILIIVTLSSDIWWSFKRYLNVALSILMLPAAFIITKNINDIKKILKPAMGLVLIFLINIAICTYLKLEIKGIGFGYGESFVYLGSVNFYSLYGFVYALIITPLGYFIVKKSHNKYLLMFMYFIGLFVLILVLKRSYVYLVLGGALIFIILISRRKSIKFIGPFFLLGLIAYWMLSDYIVTSFSARQEVIGRRYSEEGRGIELLLYPEIVRLSSDPLNFAFFGKELFNSTGKFQLIEKILNDKDRLLHSDLATILYGSGIIGLCLFGRIYYLILRKFLKFRNKLKKISDDDSFRKLSSAFVSIFICLAVNTLSDGMTIATNRVFPYLIMGAILGVMYNKLNSPVNNYSNSLISNV